MSSARVKKSKSEDKRTNKPVTHVVPKGGKKFASDKIEETCGRLHVAIDGGEIAKRQSKAFAPLRLFNDPLDYWKVVRSWGELLVETADQQIAKLNAVTITVERDGEEVTLTGADARKEVKKQAQAEYRNKQAVKRAVEDDRVHAAIAANEESLKAILAQASPEALQRLLAAAEAKQEGGEE